MVIYLLIGFLVIAAIFLITTYNRFVTIKESRLKNALQEIGNQLKRQFDLIPNLTRSVKGYMKHEQEIFKKITDARKAVSSALSSKSAQEMVDASSQLQKALQPLKIVLESTPELKAEGPTMRLMDELRDTADKLAYARRTLIDLTADYNRMVVTVPSNLVAKIFGFSQLPGLKTPESGEHLEVSQRETKSPKVEF